MHQVHQVFHIKKTNNDMKTGIEKLFIDWYIAVPELALR